jgi:hypothetical protein
VVVNIALPTLVSTLPHDPGEGGRVGVDAGTPPPAGIPGWRLGATYKPAIGMAWRPCTETRSHAVACSCRPSTGHLSSHIDTDTPAAKEPPQSVVRPQEPVLTSGLDST